MNKRSELRPLRPIWPMTVLLLSAGCADAPLDPLADGSAVRQLIVTQTNDVDASARNGTVPPAGLDPDAANAAVRRMKAAVGTTVPAAAQSSAADVATGAR
jgi:hypothetical protein